jgi:Mg/Co/Ni transporter MgtE
MKYPINSVGAHVDPKVLTLDENTNIEDAMVRIKNHQADIHSLIFILTSEQELAGYIDLKSLISGNPSQPVRSIMKKDYPKIMGNMDIQILLNRDIKDSWLLDFPVIDINGVFLGVIDRKSVFEKTTGKDVMISREKQTGMALGDLYQIGLSSLIGSVTEIFWNK